ncbi:MAG: phosphomethylpyrimidine synthase ThiC [Elusimicrobia bacterium HGW-Elusimicrobia-2]|nr:MAG: phosphomethylpyrimidine synthase ThiC [Elusimicrobia bacterium HGW-Elusimicrobia-2]
MQTKKIIRQLAAEEGIPMGVFEKNYKAGRIAIMKSRLSKRRAVAVGKDLSVKINANIGLSPLASDWKTEIKKLDAAVQYGADAVMDLSCGKDFLRVLKKVLERSTIPVGTVPAYHLFSKYKRPSPGAFFEVIEEQLALGVDFVTVHCGVTRESLNYLKKHPRLGGVVSRGGGLIFGWMQDTGWENPLYSDFGRLVKIAKKYNAVLSLGDGLRPGSISDANDYLQILELKTLGKLFLKARRGGVDAMIEGPGHIPISQIEKVVKDEKKFCHGAPFYVLGPLVTDAAAGFDHITSAIGGALAASYGADFLCYVTPAEHLGLPDADDVRLGVIASRVAAHAADVSRGRPAALKRDKTVSRARFRLDWKGMKKNLLFPEVIKAGHLSKKVCTMCGDFCPIEQTRRIMKKIVK